MKRSYPLLSVVALAFLCFSYSTSKKKVRLLVFSKTAGYRHASITKGKEAIRLLAEKNNFTIDTTEDASRFTKKNFNKYAAVIFLSTTGDVLNEEQQKAFEDFIRSGKGFMGIHAATDTEYDWPWFVKLVGANFSNHPKPQKAKLIVTDKTNLSVMHLPTPGREQMSGIILKTLTPP